MIVLFSQTSSKGNCSVIESGDKHLLVIDAGIKYKTVDKSIEYRLHTSDALLITHFHKDHTEHMKQFISSGIHTWASKKTVYNLEKNGCDRNIFLFKEDCNAIETKGFIVKPFPLCHTNSDGSECECFGFFILDKTTGEKMIFVTDTQYIKPKFAPLDFYCIECNYFETEEYDGELDYIEKSVEMRRAKSHMSCESVCKFLEMQDLSKCKEVFLLHISGSVGENGKIKMLNAVREVLRGKNCNADVKIMEGVE